MAPFKLGSIAVAIGLEWSFFGHMDVRGLFSRQFGQLNIQSLELQAGDVFVEFLRQHVYANGVLFVMQPQFDLSENLVGERGAHHVRGVTRTAAQIHQTALGKKNNPLAVWENDVVNLWLDLFPWVVFKR